MVSAAKQNQSNQKQTGKVEQEWCAAEYAYAPSEKTSRSEVQKQISEGAVLKALDSVPVKNQELVTYAYKVLMREPHPQNTNAWEHANARMQQLFGVGLADVETHRGAETKVKLNAANARIVEERFLHSRQSGGGKSTSDKAHASSSAPEMKPGVKGDDIVETLYRHANALHNQYGDNAARMIGAKNNTPDEIVERLSELAKIKEKTGHSVWDIAAKHRGDVFKQDAFNDKELVAAINTQIGATLHKTQTQPARHSHSDGDGKAVYDVQPRRGLFSRRESPAETPAPSAAPSVTGKEIVKLYERTADELQRVLGKNAAAFVGAKSNRDSDLMAAIAEKVHFKQFNGVELDGMGKYSRSHFDVQKYRVGEQEQALTKLVDAALKQRDAVRAAPEARIATIDPRISGNALFNTKSADVYSMGPNGQRVKEASAHQVSVLGVPLYERVDGEPGTDQKYGSQFRVLGMRVRNQGQETGDMLTADQAVRHGLKIGFRRPH